ncbi:hypothetical protein Tco_0123191 [Tanacetum coccineum]
MGEEFEAVEPSGTRTDSAHSYDLSDSIIPLSPDHPLTHVSPTHTPTSASFHHRTARMAVCAQPVMSLGLSASVTEAMALSDSTFCKRYRSSYKTPSSSSSPALSVRKRYRGTSELILDTNSEGDELEDEDNEEDESLDADDEREIEEEATPEGQQQVVPIVDTTASEPLGLEYGAARRHALESIEEIAPSTYEVGQSSRSMPEQQGADKLELHGSILHDHTRRLDALPPTLVADIDRDVIELYTSSGLVRDEIFLQRHGVRHVNTWMADMSRAGNDDHRLIYDMLVQQAALQRELQETRDCVIALEQERGRRKE